MRLYLSTNIRHPFQADIKITGSKSESNRLLLLQALYPEIDIKNLSNSDDAQVMQKGLGTKKGTVDIHHAGTAMRFLTAYFASQAGAEVILTGSARMQQRPVQILVDALKRLGAEISYVNQEGYPPIRISGKKLTESRTSLPANVSSQYISALLLIGGSLENGIELELVGEITSVPYINMTCSLLTALDIENSFKGQHIQVKPKERVEATEIVVESDWSSASYYYSIAALAAVGTEFRLSSYSKDSLQGDSVLKEIYRDFGVETSFEEHSIVIRKTSEDIDPRLIYDLINSPDLAQTIAVSCFGLGIGCELNGLHTLKIKETDRLLAMEAELTKLGAAIEVTDDSLFLRPSQGIRTGISIDTYNDHRMAMAFAPLAMKTDLFINDAGVVSKSYPGFWDDLDRIGFNIQED